MGFLIIGLKIPHTNMEAHKTFQGQLCLEFLFKVPPPACLGRLVAVAVRGLKLGSGD